MEETDFVLMKRGLYYRPNGHGYTSALAEAGIFNRNQADAHCQVPGVTKKSLNAMLDEIDSEREALQGRLAELDNIERRALGLKYDVVAVRR